MNDSRETRDQSLGIRWGWLKAMYLLTIIIAGGLGLGMIFVPSAAASFLEISCDAAPFGIVGSVYLAFGVISLLGLRNPLKFVPVLLLQLTYKGIWLLGVALPLLIQGRLPGGEIPTVVIFTIIVIGDLIAIPFQTIFSQRHPHRSTPDPI